MTGAAGGTGGIGGAGSVGAGSVGEQQPGAAPRVPSFAGAVLTGGRSRRMGRDKALLPVEGRPMAQRVADALRDAGADRVVAVGGDGDALAALGLPVVPDRSPGEGPLGGLLTAFEVLQDHELVVVVATDLPGLTADTVRALVNAVGEADAAFATGARGRGHEPLLGVWRIATSRAVLEAAFAGGERAVHRALAPLTWHTITVPEGVIRNVNEPHDLAR